MSGNEKVFSDGVEATVHDHPVPPEELERYSVSRDSHSENDIAQYVRSQANDETVKHVERVRKDHIMGQVYEVWDVTTDKDRWWVITNLTNLYSQKHFPSLDYTLSFHVGLMMRIRSRPNGTQSSDQDPFNEVYRRLEQTKDRFDAAVEAEDFQAVGMQLRESLLSLVQILHRRAKFPKTKELPQKSNFVDWIEILIRNYCPGKGNKELRNYIRTVAEKTWRLVSWLTHKRSANRTAALVAIFGCDMVVDCFSNLTVMQRADSTEKCPQCSSRDIRSHFDINIEPGGASYKSCGACGWVSHPEYRDSIGQN